MGISILSILAREEKKLENRMYPNVYIDDINIGRLSKDEALKKLISIEKNIDELMFHISYQNRSVGTLSAETMEVKRNTKETVERAYDIGRNSSTRKRLNQKLNSLMGWEEFKFNTTYVHNDKVVDEFIKSIASQYNKPPKNALFEMKDGRVTAFREDKKGMLIDEEDFKKRIQDYLDYINTPGSKIKKQTLVIKDNLVDADITLAKTNTLGIQELIAEGKSDYTGSNESRIHNLTLATSKFHGVIVPKGEIISFNEIIGDISVNTGYKQAYIIQNGKTVLGDGGGVCQVSTTLFRVGLNAGLPIKERHAHAYRVSYYENDAQAGFDATIYSPVIDLKIVNDTPSAILIQTEIIPERSIMYFRFYGTNDGRQVEISKANVYDVVPAPPDRHEEDPTLPKGQVKQVDFAASGAKSNFTYKVTRGDKVLQDTNFFSNYKPWAAVYMVGTME